MQNSFVGVYGCSGFGREVIPFIADQADEASQLARLPKIYFVDDNPPSEMINGYKALSWEKFSGLQGNKKAVIAISSPSTRRSIHSKILKSSVDMLSVKARNVVVYDEVKNR